MTYTNHGIYKRNLQLLPKELRKEITEIEEQLQNINRDTEKGWRKYRKLEQLKIQADNRRPDWRKTKPQLQ